MVAALVMGVTSPVHAQEPHKGAYIEIADSVHDFGDISRKGKDRKHTFHIKNSGTEPLVILSASTSCSCTKVKFSRKPIPPQEESTIEIIVEPRKVGKGVLHRVVQIHSNASNGTAILTIKGLTK